MLARLYEFNQFANKEYFEAIKQLTDFEKAFEWMTHVCEAHYIWNQRVQKKDIDIKPYKNISMEDLQKLNETNYADTLQLLKTIDLNEYISYQNLKGDQYKNKIHDILYHVINHSTYHRAQIATVLKENGVKVPSTDYIFYVRKMGY